MNLTEPQKVQAIMKWAEEMRSAYGSWVYDTERDTKHVPWEEAIAFAVCGSYSDLPEIIPEEIFPIMKEWAIGNFPEWLTLSSEKL